MKRIMRQYFIMALVLFGLASTFIGASIGRAQEKKAGINVGCKNFTEQQIASEMVSILLEDKYHVSVNRVFNLDGTLVAFEALRANNIDVFMEYTGTMLIEILDEKDFRGKSMEWIDEKLLKEKGIRWVHPTGHNNTYTLLVPDDTDLWTIEDLSDLLEKKPHAKIAVSHEFHARPEFQLLKEFYPYFDRVIDLDECFVYLTVANRDIDVGVGYGTDGKIEKYHLRALEDSKGALPDYKAAFAVHQSAYEKHPELIKALAELEGILTDKEIRQLNDQVDTGHRSPYLVAKEFLIAKELL